MTVEAEFLHVESGSGEPLVLVHGGEGDRHQFDLFRPLLGDGVRALAYDQRDTPDNPYAGQAAYSMRDLASDYVAFIRSLGLERAHVLGTSYGGVVAMTIAIHFPDSVQSLILACTTPSYKLIEPPTVEVTSRADPDTIVRILIEQEIPRELLENDPRLADEIRATIRPGAADGVERRMAAARAHEARDELRLIKAPTLVLHGEDDPFVKPELAVLMAEQIPGAELEIFPGVRHSLTTTHRRATAPRVRKFVLEHAMD